MSDAIEQAADALVFIRRPRPTDQSFIASTWVDSMKLGTKRSTHPRAGLNATVDQLLDDAAVRLLIASEPSRQDVILGWICYTPMPGSRIIHYVYVRERMRRRGIAAALYRKAFPRDVGKLVYTMRGPDAESLAKRYRDAISMPLEDFLG